MNAPAQTSINHGASSARDLFALTDEQILQIEPDPRDAEIFAGERTDAHDPLREDLDLLTAGAPVDRQDDIYPHRSQGKSTDDGLKAVATNADLATQHASATSASTNPTSMVSGEPPKWLAQRMNDPQNGAAARALWDGVLTARQEASAFREVFAKPEDARAAAERARTLDDFDRGYFGAAGQAPEQLSASRAELAARMLREDPAAFREMVFAGLHALETAAQQGSSAGVVAPPFRAASSAAAAPQSQPSSTQPALRSQESQKSNDVQDERVAAYAAFERATNAELERGIGGAIDRSLQAALPNAARSENGVALKERLGAAIRQDVEKALQGDRALGEQVARVLSGHRLDGATRAQVVRLISERAQQLVPGSARRVLADWTQTTLASHGSRVEQTLARAPNTASHANSNTTAERKNTLATDRSAPLQRNPRKIDYRRVSDDDILDS
jgi:hypothetical protein